MKKLNKKVLSASTITAVLLSSSLSAVNVKADNLISPPENSRLWGQDRYETAVKVSQTGWTSSDYAVIASGEGYADALCAAPLAKANNAPILLTENGKLNDKTLEELKRLNVKHVYIVGGQGVVAKAVEDSIKSNTKIDIERFAGQNRYETSVKVAEKIGVTSKVVLASGEGYADALSAAPVAAIEGIPVLLTESKTLSAPTADYIKANKDLTKTYVIGGYASVSDSTMNSVPGAQRFGGANRYETNVQVIENFASDFEFNNAYVALGNGPIGNEFADALTGAALAAKNKNPLILVSKDLDKSTENLLKSKFPKTATITVLGGTANISDSLVSSIKSDIENSTDTKPSTGGGGSSSSTTTKHYSIKVASGVNSYTHDITDRTVSEINSMTVKQFYNTYVSGRSADTENMKKIINKIGEKVNLRDVKVGDKSINQFAADALKKAGYTDLAAIVDKKAYNEAAADLFSKNYDEVSKFMHALVTEARNNPQYFNEKVTIDGKKVKSIAVKTSQSGTLDTIYNSANEDNKKVDLAKITTIKNTYLGSKALSDITMSELKAKYIEVVVTTESGVYKAVGTNGEYTVSGPSGAQYTISIEEQ